MKTTPAASFLNNRLVWFGLLAGAVLATGDLAAAETSSGIFDVRAFGAIGDGKATDTASLNRAIDACAVAGGGQVYVPPGDYRTGTVYLRSHLTLFLAPGARLVGTTNLAEYGQPQPPSFVPEARWGKWHRGLIVGENVEDVTICGSGTIDGNKVFDPEGEEHMRGPHGVVFVNCRRFAMRDITIRDAANYGIYFQVSDDVEIRNVKFIGGWDGVHWRGAPERWCNNVRILGCQFYTGDDSIAGRYWDQTVISDCVINSSCNGIRLIGPATRLIVNRCLFYGPGLQPHRTSGERRRTNMLSGIILQPGAWDATRGLLDDVLIAGITMQNVASPVTIWNRTGNTVGRITIADLVATGVYRSAISVEGWSDAPITNVTLRAAQVEFLGGGRQEQLTQRVQSPGVDARALPAWGLYARNVRTLTVQDVRMSLTSADSRPVLAADGVEFLNLDNFKFDPSAGTEPIWTTNVANLNWPGRSR